MLKLLLIRIFKNLASMVLGPQFIIWGLKLATSMSSNKIDDNCVGIVEAAYDNDVEKLKKHAEALAAIYKAK